jgi:hypothetical protein
MRSERQLGAAAAVDEARVRRRRRRVAFELASSRSIAPAGTDRVAVQQQQVGAVVGAHAGVVARANPMFEPTSMDGTSRPPARGRGAAVADALSTTMMSCGVAAAPLQRLEAALEIARALKRR